MSDQPPPPNNAPNNYSGRVGRVVRTGAAAPPARAGPRRRGAPKKAQPGRRGAPAKAPARAGGAPKKAQPRRRGTSKKAGDNGNRVGDVRRLVEIERELERLRQEKLALAVKPVREMPFPRNGVIDERRGSTYATWFKAAGSLGGGRGWDSYERMQHLLDESDAEINAPAAFFSAHIIGQVKWRGILPLQQLIDQLNFVGPWGGDFREIYPRWNIEYRVIESIGGVPVRIWAKYLDNSHPKGKRIR